MHASRFALPSALAFIAAAAGCAGHSGSEPIGPDPRDVGVIAPGDAEGIPMYTQHGVPGCRYRSAGNIVAQSLLEMRDEANQKQADAVIDVRKQVQATLPPVTRDAPVRPAAYVYYTGTAVRVEPGCRTGPAPQEPGSPGV
jgi:hypothetical protein